ncbi:ATP synthase subunit epsilon, mitochondrial [Tanacetum coccineum]
MASTAAVPFWRSAGMTYITYSNICANLVRNCLKEPYKSEAINREKVHFSVSKWTDGKPEKPIATTKQFKILDDQPGLL